ncbi:ArdC-like ssDNA-binding domain-containing protein, partial [Escherichia coli]
AADEAGYVSNDWLTYRQAQQLGGHVRKGEVATLAVI